MVFPHRACGFAAGAAPIPVYGWDFSSDHSGQCLGVSEDKVAAGVNPAAKATLATGG
jgi:hypothetical protein